MYWVIKIGLILFIQQISNLIPSLRCHPHKMFLKMPYWFAAPTRLATQSLRIHENIFIKYIKRTLTFSSALNTHTYTCLISIDQQINQLKYLLALKYLLSTFYRFLYLCRLDNEPTEGKNAKIILNTHWIETEQKCYILSYQTNFKRMWVGDTQFDKFGGFFFNWTKSALACLPP